MRWKEIFETKLNLPDIETGDEIFVGKFKNRRATITGFKKDDHNQPVLKTTRGDQKLFKPRFPKLEESSADDLTASDIVRKAWIETYNYIYGKNPLQEINIKDRDGVCIFMRDIPNIDPIFNKTCVAFVPHQDYNLGASTSHVKPISFGCDTFVVFNVLDIDNLLGVLSKNDYIFQHELIHVIDYYRYKSPEHMPYGDPKDRSAYYNDPVELNAYYHNLAEPLLSRLSIIRSSGIEALELYDPLPTNFTDFLQARIKTLKHAPLKNFWKHLSDKNRNRILKRLHGLYSEYEHAVIVAKQETLDT